MDALFDAFRDESFRSSYVLFAFAVMVLPMAALAWWYHTNIRKTPGGRALMQRQNAAPRHLASGVQMAGEISRGKYGDAAKRMQTRVSWIVALWVVALIVVFGLLIWADEVNRAAPGA